VSFFSDLVEGKSGNLGHDLNPGNILSDAGTDFAKQPAWAKGLEIAAPLAIGALATGGADLAALPGIFGAEGAADAGAAGGLGFAADVGADAGAGSLDAFLADPLAAGAGAGTAGATTALPADALALTAPAGDVAAGGAAAGSGAWPAALDLGGGTAADVGGTAGAPLSLAAPAAGGSAAPAAGGSTGILSSIGAGLKTAAPFVGAAGLAGSLYEGYEQKQQINATNKTEQAAAAQAAQTQAIATQTAAPLINQGQTLMSYLTSGTLPPQFQTQVDQTIASQKAGIIQGYAARGMSTNPQQNSQLQQDLAAVDNSRNTLMTQLESQLATAGQNMVSTANQMLATGLSATQLEAQIPIQISKLNLELNQSMMQSISNFAAAMNGGKFTSLTPSTPTAGTA
jgi:hypothetical protein